MSVGGVNGFNNINPIRPDTVINNKQKISEKDTAKVENKPSLNLQSNFQSTVNSKNASFEPVSLFSDSANSKVVSTAKNTFKTLSDAIDLEKGKLEVIAKNLLAEAKKHIKAE